MRKRILLVTVLVLLFALVAVCVQMGVTVALEEWFYAAIAVRMTPQLTALLHVITRLGDPMTVILFALLLIAVPRTRRTIAVPVAVAELLSVGLNQLLKRLFMRERPDILRLIVETNFSFPSGHAMTSATLYLMLILLAHRYGRTPRSRWLLTALFASLWGIVGLSRVYLGVHYAGDVLGGWLLGSAVAVGVYGAWSDWVQKKQG